MRWPEDGRATIRALASNLTRPVTGVRLLGHGSVPYEQADEGLQILLPPFAPIDGPHGLAIVQS
jgi:alpha-L-fucosidase